MSLMSRATAILTIDLAAIVENWRRIKARVGAAEVAGVVKADAYGLGAARVAPALAAAGCRTFFIATIDEGIALRALCPDARILALCGAMPGTEADLAEHRLVPVLNSLEQVADWSACAKARGGLEAALHVDTGMSRLGLDAPAVAALSARPDLLDGIRTILVMSHMACADEADHPKNVEQLDAFRRLQAVLPAAPRSLGASSTIFLGPDYHFDLVRPGACLYGINPIPGQPNPMRPVVGLRAKILQVRDVDTPMTVGYGATHRVTAKGRLAIVAAGYADGLFRSLGNRGFGVIGGVRVPVVGRISMDLTAFDVSAAPADAVRPGAFIDIIGPGHDTDDLATEA
ncbi:MAG TPA: alanine racemase, partial [Candidatus Omnitrophota bacterium]|nr:alanine racemase [Candidatus Omnitrophota bacterium]